MLSKIEDETKENLFYKIKNTCEMGIGTTCSIFIRVDYGLKVV